MSFISSDKVRAARGLVNWSQEELARRTGLHIDTIRKGERGVSDFSHKSAKAIVYALDLAGVEITSDGVRFKNIVSILEGDDANNRVLEDIYASLKDVGGEVLIAGLTELPPDHKSYPFVKAHIERLQEAGISERILIEEGDMNLIGPSEWYRYLPRNRFNDSPFQIYGSKIALKNWGPPQRIVVIEDEQLVKTARNMFDILWDIASPVKEGRS